MTKYDYLNWNITYLNCLQIFHTVFIRDIPIMNLKTKSEARRFITMIDTFYDNKTRIVASGAAPYWDLFQPEEMSDEVKRFFIETFKIKKLCLQVILDQLWKLKLRN